MGGGDESQLTKVKEFKDNLKDFDAMSRISLEGNHFACNRLV